MRRTDQASRILSFPGFLKSIVLLVWFIPVLVPVTLQGQELPAIRSVTETPFVREPVEYFEGELLIRFREGVDEAGREQFRREMGVRESQRLERSNVELVRMDPERAHRMLERGVIHPDLEFYQPNFVYRMIAPVSDEETDSNQEPQETHRSLPDDPEFFRQWGLLNEGQPFRGLLRGQEGADIDASRAWGVATGSDDVIIAIFDTGIDYNHPDLEANLYRDEQGRPGVDCSPSGMVAPGICGDDPMDENGHGTHIAGIIGMVGDNARGGAGVNWDVQLMAVKIFSEDPESDAQVTSEASILAGYEYALTRGVRVSNHSYGSPDPRTLMEEMIREAGRQDHLVVAAAGNNGNNNDNQPIYPASYDLDNIISVAASDFNDQLAWFSNFGPETVHIAAPGDQIFSTYPENLTSSGGPLPEGFKFLSGTSMAAPHVAGVAGLIQSVFPSYGYREIRELLLDEADRLPALEQRVRNASRLNAFNSLPTAGLEFVHAAPVLEEAVEVRLNGEPLVGPLNLAVRSERVRVPAEQDIDLSFYLEGDLVEFHQQSIQFEADRNYYVVMGENEEGDDTSLVLFTDTIREKEIADDDVRLLFVNAVSGLGQAGWFGFYPDDRPPFVITESLLYGTFLDDHILRPVNVELDLTFGDELKESFELPLADDGGATILLVAAGNADDERHELVVSREAGEGALAVKITPVGREARHVPDRFVLEDNFPNPFYPRTQIQFTLPEGRDVRLDIYDILGRRVQTLRDEWMPGGIHRVEFDASGLSSGAYLFRIQAGDEVESGKMMIIR